MIVFNASNTSNSKQLLLTAAALLLLGFGQPAEAQNLNGQVFLGDQLPLFLPNRNEENHMHLAKDQDEFRFKTKVLAKRGVSLVEFVLPTCGACNPVSRSIINLVSRYGGEVGYVRLDLNKNLRLSFKYDVPEVPAVLVFRDGELEERFVVYKREMLPQLVQSIEQQLVLAKRMKDARLAEKPNTEEEKKSDTKSEQQEQKTEGAEKSGEESRQSSPGQ